MLQQSGTRLERQSTDFVSTAETIRPLRDQVIVKPLPWEPSRTIQITGNTRRTLRGTVVAVGPGHYPKRYSPDRSKSWDSKAFQRTEVKIGDVVELGGLEIDGYSFPTVSIGNELHVICREADVAMVRE